MNINYAAIAKRANKLIEKAASKLHSARVHIVTKDTDIKELSGLVIILNPATSKTSQKSAQAKPQPTDSDISENE